MVGKIVLQVIEHDRIALGKLALRSLTQLKTSPISASSLHYLGGFLSDCCVSEGGEMTHDLLQLDHYGGRSRSKVRWKLNPG